MQGNNLVLTGMPGAGKSTLGVLLAKILGKLFIDTDLIIQQQEGRLLQEIIDQDGIGAFLKIEEKAILALRPENTVIATGGSVIYSAAAIKHLKKQGLLVYLKLTYEEIESRIKNMAARGIVMEKGRKLVDLYNERIPLYEKYADIVADCSKKTIEESVQSVIKEISKCCDTK